MKTEEKLKKLEEILESYSHVTVALSGGVDSTFMLAFAWEYYRKKGDADRVAALTAIGPQFPANEAEYAQNLCDTLGIPHKKIDVSHVVGMIKRNPADRCYHCKREIFSIMSERAGLAGSTLVDGENADDRRSYRPGHRVAEELGVKSPLLMAGLTKEEIRKCLVEINIEKAGSRADYPAQACLLTRIPYGETITEKKLASIEAAEKFLKEQVLSQVRVRCHEIAGKVSGNEERFMARIELIPEEFQGMLRGNVHVWSLIDENLRKIGFEHVSLDMGGYKSGSMDAGVKTDRIEVTETVKRGSAENIEKSGNEAVMAEIDRFLSQVHSRKYTFSDFVDVIERLRRPDGCPWDREQTHESLKKHMVEEANEALEAIDERDWGHLCEELGDLLLQIVLHARIAAEAGEFTIDDVVQSVTEKMIRRHPHVFGDIDISSVDEGLDLWEEIKKREKMAKKAKNQ